MKRGRLEFYLGFLLVVMICLVLLKYIQSAPIRLQSVHAINMRKSQDRWAEISDLAEKAGVPLQRWEAVDGTTVGEDDARRLGVSKLLIRHTTEKKQPGVVGVFLSHKTLLKHLETQSAHSGDAHLILEDDAYIPADFWNQWAFVSSEFPADWDIVQLGVTYPNLKPMAGCRRLHAHQGAKGNVGAFAYVVRHASLPKINQHLIHMYDPIDVMIRNKQDEWGIYYAWPEICKHNDHGQSTIVAGAPKN
jgi:GR25 family glycosyltransferase involved in LPS biosynthesis